MKNEAYNNRAEQHAISIQEVLVKPFIFEYREIIIGASVSITLMITYFAV